MTRAPRPSRSTLVVLGLLMVAAAIVVQHAGRGTIFFYDEWNFITARRGFSADSFLEGHNGHLSVFPVAVYKVLLQVVGLTEYWPYRLTLVLLHLVTAGLFFVAIRSRIGDAAAVCGAALILFLGSAGEDLVWAFQIGFVGSIAAGLGMLIALDRRTGRGDLAAMVLLGVTLGCSSLGVPFLVVALVELALQRDWRRLARVVAVPLTLYLLWQAAYGGESEIRSGNIDDAPAFAFQMLAAALGGLSGFGASAGPTLAVAALGGLALAVVRRPPSPRLLALMTGAAALWGLTALARAQFNDPGASRYIYASVVLVLLAGAELWPRGYQLRGRILAVAAVATAIMIVGNLLPLNQKAGGLRANSENVKARITALQLAGPQVSPDLQPAPEGAPQIFAGQYRGAVASFGSPADSEAELRADIEPDRAAADDVLQRASAPIPQAAPAPPSTRACTGVPAGGDVPLLPGRVLLTVPRGGSPSTAGLRRFADGVLPSPLATVAPGQAVLVTTIADGARTPWALRVDAAVEVCPA